MDIRINKIFYFFKMSSYDEVNHNLKIINNDINHFRLSDRIDMLRVKKKKFLNFDLTEDRYLKKEKIDNKKINLPQYNYYKIDFR